MNERIIDKRTKSNPADSQETAAVLGQEPPKSRTQRKVGTAGENQKLERRPRARRGLGLRSRLVIGGMGLTAAMLSLNQCGLSIPGVPKIHEDLNQLPPEIDDDVVVTKLGAIGAFAKSSQTYKSKAYVELVNDKGEERETLGYIGTHKVVRTQEGRATVESDDQGNKTVHLPTTIGLITRGDTKLLHDERTGRDAGQAIMGYITNSQTPRELGASMYADQIQEIAAADEISNRQTLCVGVAATSQFLADIGFDGYFVPTWQVGDQPNQPANTRRITVQAMFGEEALTVESCAADLVTIGYNPQQAGNMQPGAAVSDAEVEAGMLLPERRLKDQVVQTGRDAYLEASE